MNPHIADADMLLLAEVVRQWYTDKGGSLDGDADRRIAASVIVWLYWREGDNGP